VGDAPELGGVQGVGERAEEPLAFLRERGISAAAIDAVVDEPLLASREAPPDRERRWPLLLVAQGNGQDAVDQSILAEYLASFGFVVASVPSPMLRRPMTGESEIGEFAELQADDLERAWTAAEKLLPVDGSRVFPVGRLDLDSEGLLLAMNDGDLANALTHPSYEIEKEYLVEVAGTPAGRYLAALRAGVALDDGPARARSVRIVDTRPDRAQLSIVMTEGRKREVRRMLQALELPVRRLLRVRIGPVRLGGLAPGQHRELTPDELLDLGTLVARAERRLRRRATDAL